MSDLRNKKKKGLKMPAPIPPGGKGQNPRNSGLTPVAPCVLQSNTHGGLVFQTSTCPGKLCQNHANMLSNALAFLRKKFSKICASGGPVEGMVAEEK